MSSLTRESSSPRLAVSGTGVIEFRSVTGSTQTELLLDSVFQDELHALLWIDPRSNSGTLDGGWSCRDHVVVLGTLLVENGVGCRVQHGRSMFCQGSGQEGEPALANGQTVDFRPMSHSWLDVDGIGIVDLSPQLDSRFYRRDLWHPVSSRGVIGDRWMTEPPTSVTVVGHLSEYDNEIAAASHLVEGQIAIYLLEGEEQFTKEITEEGLEWANSPLSIKLRDRGLPSDVYGRASRHLGGLDGRRSLSTVSQMKAWSILGDDDALSLPTPAV
jgi:hypothetical protein